MMADASADRSLPPDTTPSASSARLKSAAGLAADVFDKRTSGQTCESPPLVARMVQFQNQKHSWTRHGEQLQICSERLHLCSWESGNDKHERLYCGTVTGMVSSGQTLLSDANSHTRQPFLSLSSTGWSVMGWRLLTPFRLRVTASSHSFPRRTGPEQSSPAAARS